MALFLSHLVESFGLCFSGPSFFDKIQMETGKISLKNPQKILFNRQIVSPWNRHSSPRILWRSWSVSILNSLIILNDLEKKILFLKKKKSMDQRQILTLKVLFLKKKTTTFYSNEWSFNCFWIWLFPHLVFISIWV